MKLITRHTDNGTMHTVKAEIDVYEQYAKSVLGWKTPTERYNSIFDRLENTGSTNWNKVITTMYFAGYGI